MSGPGGPGSRPGGPAGSRDGYPATAVLEIAHEVGALLAAAGAVVLTGGLDGVMAAAAKGARAAGGTVIGLLPGTDAAAGNEHLSVAVPTGLGQGRNALLVGAADGVIAIGGSWGTLSEVALAMRAAKPVVWVHGWTIAEPAGAPVPVPSAPSASAAVEMLLNRLSRAG